MKNKFINNEDVKTKFGVTPDKVVDVQSLAGDSSDNVPGVPGIGVKTAAELINKYKTLENLLDKAQEIKQNKRRETILENKDKALISKKLVTLKKDVPVKDNLEDFILKNIDKDKLFSFLREMEFNRLLSSVISVYGQPEILQQKTIKKENINKEINTKKYQLIKNIEDLDDWISEAEKKGEFAIDTETTSLDPHQADLVGISLSTDIGKACYIPIGHTNGKCLNKKEVIDKLKPILEDKSVKKIGQNIKFDYLIFYHLGVNLNSLEDTMLISYVLDAGKNRHNMDTLSEIHLGHKTISFKDLVGTGKKQISFNEVEIQKASEYAAEDADITLRLYKVLKENLKQEKLENIYELFEKPLIKILAKMEINGIKVDDKYLKILSKNFDKRIKEVEKKFLKYQIKSLILVPQNNLVR